MNLPERYMAMYVNYYNTHWCSEYWEIVLHKDASWIYLGWQVPLDENIFKIKKWISSLSFRMYSGNLWKVVLMNQEIIDYILEHNVRNQFHTEW
jgi:hypothetical protein